MRLGPGPVFVYEWLTSSRRWQPYAQRSGFVWLLLIGMAMAHSAVERGGPDGLVSLADTARFGQNLYRSIAWIELTLILLVAPAATAGAVCLDRARGTLDHMLATDLSNAEIVLGKLFVRLIPVLGLIACTAPVLALASLLGGIDPTAMLGLFLVSVGCAFVGCALAIVLSVHGRKAHEVVMMTYLLIVLWILAPAVLQILEFAVPPAPPPGPSTAWATVGRWVYLSNPYGLVFAQPGVPPSVDGWTFLAFLSACLAISAVLVAAATARVRRVALRQAGRPESGRHRPRSRAFGRLRLPGPSMDRNPVAWREWHRTRPSLMMRIAWGMYAALGLLWVGLSVTTARVAAPPGMPAAGDLMIALMNMIQVSIGLILLSVSASASLAEERARGSLDVLLSTPISTRSILAGKWWGNYRRVLGVAIWPAATTAILAWDRGYWLGYALLLGLVLAHGAAITALGLAIATWIRRPGRAIAMGVATPVLLAIGWPIGLLFVLQGSGNHELGQALLTGDPPIGVLFATMAVSAMGEGRIAPGATRGDLFLWTSGWIVVLALVSAVLFVAARATFDGCLGRIPDEGFPRPFGPRGRSARSADESAAMVPGSPEAAEPS